MKGQKKYKAISLISKALGDLHWVELHHSCSGKGKAPNFVAVVFADWEDDQSPAYLAHFHGMPYKIRRVAMIPLNDTQSQVPQIDALQVTMHEEIPDQPVYCPLCHYQPDINARDLADVVALWPKRACGAGIEINHLDHLVERWLS